MLQRNLESFTDVGELHVLDAQHPASDLAGTQERQLRRDEPRVLQQLQVLVGNRAVLVPRRARDGVPEPGGASLGGPPGADPRLRHVGQQAGLGVALEVDDG